MSVPIPTAVDHLAYRYPSVLVDDVTSRSDGACLAAVKNVTVNEEFFQGHFPGTPLMPGVLMIESFAQVAAVLIVGQSEPGTLRTFLRGVNQAKFRRQVVPGDRLEMQVTLGRRRGPLAAF